MRYTTRAQTNGYINIAGVKVGGGWVGRRVASSGRGGGVRFNHYVTPAFAIDGEAYRVVVRQQDKHATQANLRTDSSYSLD